MEYIGYDRPLKPEWIYKTLRLIEPGEKPEIYYEPYNNIAVELTGKDGRRKTRTILFRTYIYSFQETSSIKSNFLIELCKIKDFEYTKPILLSKLIIDYYILSHLTKTITHVFDPTQELISTVVTSRMIEKYGDTEIVKRSTRSFLKTLSDFKILHPLNKTTFIRNRKQLLSDEQVKDILKLYAISNETKQIDLDSFDMSILLFYNYPFIDEVGKTFHKSEWEFIRSNNRRILLIK